MIRKKILLLGDFHVGKTSLIRRYVDNSFSDKYLTTIGVKISRKQIELPQDILDLMIWDIEGATPIKEIPKTYLHGASGAIIVGDLTRSETIDNISYHIEKFINVNPKSPYLIAHNKADLVYDECQKDLEKSGGIFLTSAKDDCNVQELFITLAKRIVE